jgi:5-hydroxyisourate hydrolase
MTMNAIGRREVLGAGAALAVVAATGSDAEAQSKPPNRLSTHVLDTYNGIPGEGVTIEFFKMDADQYVLQKTVTTNHDGRAGEPLLPVEGAASLGRYRLVFHVADYFKKIGAPLPNPPFIDRVSVDFAIYEEKEHYHVPLLCSPWSYTTYRGS